MTSPLREIEDAVLEAAKSVDLDLSRPTAAAELRKLVAEQVERWDEDVRRGVRTVPLADPNLVAERAYRNLAGHGPLEDLLTDDDVWEIMVNAPDAIFVKRHSGRSGYHDEAFHDDEHVLRTLTKVLDEATGAHRKLDPADGLQDAQLDSGARLHIVHSDVARDGHLLVNIRKFTGVAFKRLDDLVDRGMLDPPAAAFLRAAVDARLSVLFAGPPGSGKTTLMSCCASELDPALRVVVAEEVFETDVPLPNVAHMQTRPARPDRPAVDLRRLVSGFMRMAPDVAIVGEVRDKEALPLLLTLSSGVTGYTTIHAGSARQALSRLRFICQLADGQLSAGALTSLVSETVDLVVHCDRHAGIPLVTEIVAVEDPQGPRDTTTFTTTSVFAREQSSSPLCWTGNLPVRAARSFERRGLDLRSLLDVHSTTLEAAGLDLFLGGQS